MFVAFNTLGGCWCLGGISLQPADPIKLVLIAILAKYFSRRHIEIANIRHILVSGFYSFVFFVLIAIQPDFGSAIIIFLIWFGMVLVSGISKKHLALVFFIGLLSFGGLWFYVFKDYQKHRIINFIHPLSDIRGTGYNAYQSTIAVGSGEIFGKGVGFGTQSRLKFLPEFETDFIFASFAEEWGFLGALILISLYAIVVWRILLHSMRGATNFEMLFGLGLAVYIMSHFFINVGMNIGLLPVTGITLPFMSYGGSHLLTEFAGLGMLMGMSRYQRTAHKDLSRNELLGV
jgi:rod shape determining protein RodA